MEGIELYNEDCLEGIRELEDGSVKSIITDPPYFLGMTHNGQKGNFVDLAICKPFYTELAKEFHRVLRLDGEFYIFMDWRGYAFYYPIFAGVLPVRNMIVWDKQSGPGNFYSFAHELILYGYVDNRTTKHSQNIWREKSFCSGAKATDGEKQHPTQKPLGIITRAVLDSTEPGDLALDCFMGSGTTAVACVNTGRRFVGFELDERYFKIAQGRVEEAEKTRETNPPG